MDILSANHESLILICLGVFVVLLKSAEKSLLVYLSSINILQSSVIIMNKMSGTNLTLPLFMIQNLLSDKNNLNNFCEDTSLLNTCLHSLGKSISKENLPLKLIKSIVKVYSMIIENNNGKKAISQKVPKTLFNKDFYNSLDDATKSYLDSFHSHFKSNKKLKEIIQNIKGVSNDNSSLNLTNLKNINFDLTSHCSKDTLNYYFNETTLDETEKIKPVNKEAKEYNDIEEVNKENLSHNMLGSCTTLKSGSPIKVDSKERDNESRLFQFQMQSLNLLKNNSNSNTVNSNSNNNNIEYLNQEGLESTNNSFKFKEITELTSNNPSKNTGLNSLGTKLQSKKYKENSFTPTSRDLEDKQEKEKINSMKTQNVLNMNNPNLNSINNMTNINNMNNLNNINLNSNLGFYNGEKLMQIPQDTLIDKVTGLPFPRNFNQYHYIQDPRLTTGGHVNGHLLNFPSNVQGNNFYNPVITQPNINISNIYMSNYYNNYGNQ
jgi:hypothetical protein